MTRSGWRTWCSFMEPEAPRYGTVKTLLLLEHFEELWIEIQPDHTGRRFGLRPLGFVAEMSTEADSPGPRTRRRLLSLT